MELEISEPTFRRWRNQYGGMKADDAKRLKEFERAEPVKSDVNRPGLVQSSTTASDDTAPWANSPQYGSKRSPSPKLIDPAADL